jgi:hypothetical protein
MVAGDERRGVVIAGAGQRMEERGAPGRPA